MLATVLHIERVTGMDNKKTEGNQLLAEIKKSRKTKRKNKKCEEYAVKKFRENRDGKRQGKQI